MTRSADRLVAARDARAARAGVGADYNAALERAHKLSKTAGTAAEHRAAATAFRQAAARSTGGNSRTLHTLLADNHDRMAVAEERNNRGDLHKLNHQAAALHHMLSFVVSDPKAREYHVAERQKHQNLAKKFERG